MFKQLAGTRGEKSILITEKSDPFYSVLIKWINEITTSKDQENFSALHFAAFSGCLSILRLLEKFGGDLSI